MQLKLNKISTRVWNTVSAGYIGNLTRGPYSTRGELFSRLLTGLHPKHIQIQCRWYVDDNLPPVECVISKHGMNSRTLYLINNLHSTTEYIMPGWYFSRESWIYARWYIWDKTAIFHDKGDIRFVLWMFNGVLAAEQGYSLHFNVYCNPHDYIII